MLQHVSGPTHDLGGTLDVVCTRSDLPAPSVQVTDVGISDHRLLYWSSHLCRELPTYTSTSCRSWRLFDLDTFTTDLSSSLCSEQHWQGLDADGLAMLYDVTATQLLDSPVPVRCVTWRRRQSSAWFDECRQVKRSLRTAEKAACKASPLSDTSLPAVSEWCVVARPGACQVQVMCVGLPVSARHGTVVPRRRPPADFRCRYPPSTPVC